MSDVFQNPLNRRPLSSMLLRVASAWIVAAFALVIHAAPVQADASLTRDGMDLHLFRPAVDSRGHISVNGTDLLPHKDFSFGLVLDAGFGILRYRGFITDEDLPIAQTERENRVVRSGFTGTFHFNYGLFDRLELGLSIPIVFFNGKAVQVPGAYNEGAGAAGVQGLSQQGIGDIGLHAKVRLLNAALRHVGLAAVLRVQFPTGDAKEFSGEPGVALWPSVVLELRPISKIRFSFEGGYRAVFGDGTTFPFNGRTVPTGTNAANPMVTDAGTALTYDDLITFGFGASFRFARAAEFVMELYGTQLTGEFGSDGALSMEALGGFKFFVLEHSYLLVAAGGGLPDRGFQASNVRGILGFIFEPSIRDRDGDGIRDDIDQCVDKPEDKDGFEDSDGCPDPDNDADGILDKEDKCPLVPENYNGIRDEDGCPEGADGDRDGDGIPDSIDKCPDDPEDFDDFEDEDGCPDPDNDGDGILDKDDLCPNDPEDFDGFEDEDGCPDVDNDGDRILDKNDNCPADPETYNGFEDEDGCPDKGSVIVEEDEIRILEKIYFDYDSAVIQERSYPILDAVAATLQGNPHILLVEVQGHADERGSDRYNISLTRARAASVVDALIERGVLSSRLRSAGYGERCPIAKGHNERAWEKNRRSEFKIIQTESGPTGVRVACPRGRSLIPK